jgi:YVTN family beta-propeller protein
MRFLKDRKLIAIAGTFLVIILLISITFIAAVSVNGSCITPSPVISASPTTALYGQPITVSGQYFTPNKKAFLFTIDPLSGKSGLTADVDKNGNTSWVIIEQQPNPRVMPNYTYNYSIYAQDVSVAGNMSNSITLTLIHDPYITFIAGPPAGPTTLPITESTSTPTPTSSTSNAAMTGPYAYIPNNMDNTVSVIDTQTNTVTATISVGPGPDGAAVNPAGTRVYVTNAGMLRPDIETGYYGSSVSVIDTAKNAVIATVPVGGGAYGVAVNPSGTRIYVASLAANTVSVIDASTNNVTATIKVEGTPYGVAVNPSGTRIYVTNVADKTVTVINAVTNRVVATVHVGVNPWDIAVNLAGTRIYVANQASYNVSVIDAKTNAVIDSVPIGMSPKELAKLSFGPPIMGANPENIAVNPAGTRIYAANNNNDNVSVIDATSNAVIANVSVGLGPKGIAVTPDGTKIYVLNSGNNTVSVIDAATNTVTDTVPVGNFPMSIGQFIGPARGTSTPIPTPFVGADVISAIIIGAGLYMQIVRNRE